jgi:hypothetical protein
LDANSPEKEGVDEFLRREMTDGDDFFNFVIGWETGCWVEGVKKILFLFVHVEKS